LQEIFLCEYAKVKSFSYFVLIVSGETLTKDLKLSFITENSVTLSLICKDQNGLP